MSNIIPFHCPDCANALTVHAGTEIHDADGTPCQHCDRIVHQDELIQQAKRYATGLSQGILGTLFK